MIHFPRFASCLRKIIPIYGTRFPYSDILGLTVARHLPEAYRSHATSFIALISQGIHHLPLHAIYILPAISNHYVFSC